MSPRNRCIAISVSLTGVVVCCLGLLAFFSHFVNKTLPWSPGLSQRAHYMTVGQYYGQGFLIGFFLCFFLMLVAVVGSREFARPRRSGMDSPSGRS